MENLNETILNEFGREQYNPITNRKDFKTYDEFKATYRRLNQGWSIYFQDIEKAVAVAVHETRRKDIEIIEELRPNATREKLTTTARNYTDALEIVISKLKAIKEVRFYD